MSRTENVVIAGGGAAAICAFCLTAHAPPWIALVLAAVFALGARLAWEVYR